MPDPLYSGRYTQAWAITPSDTVTVSGPAQSGSAHTPYCSGILALTGGNVTATFSGDRGNSSVTFPVLEGVLYPFSLAFVYTATTATLLGLL